MKRNLLTLGLLAFNLSLGAQVLCHVDNGGVFFVGENALVYNGGGVQTKGNGIYDIRGNVMIEGNGTSVLKTLSTSGGDKTDGGNFILRLNSPTVAASSTYGQLYINGLVQGNMTAIIDKEYRTRKHGTYQQIAIPFYNKTLSSLSGSASTMGTLGKTFSNTRYSKNEILTWNNTTAVSDNLSVSALTPKSTTYYMLGSNNFDADNPPLTMPSNPDPSALDFGTNPTRAGVVYTLRGQPFTNGVNELLSNAGNGINFGTGGNATNSYNERYNTYHGDDWDATLIPLNPWSAATYGRNIYQFGNPYFTNLDLSFIGTSESGATNDNNIISSIQGIRYDPGLVVTTPNVGTYSVGAQVLNFTAGSPVAVGDIGLIIKPMQTFVVKLRDNFAQVGTDKTLSFDNLRRFKYNTRTSGGSVSKLGD